MAVSVNGWTLLKSQADFDRFHKRKRALYGKGPASFPCFAREIFTADEETQYLFLLESDLAVMRKMIDAEGK